MPNGRRPTEDELAQALRLRPSEPRPQPEERELQHLAAQSAESSAGKGEAAPRTRFTAHERERVLPPVRLFKSEQPRWVRALAERRADDDELLDTVVKRLRRAPTRSNLLLAQAILHDLGRKPGGGERLRKIITQDLVDEIQNREG